MNDSLYYELSDLYWLYSSKKDYLKESEVLDYLLKKYRIPGKKILDIGCGQGDHMFFLGKKGYELFGIDKAEKQIKNAKEKYKNLSFECCDFLDYKPSIKYNGIVLLWNVILYFSPKKKLDLVFSKIKEVISTRGLVIFDFRSFLEDKIVGGFKSKLVRERHKKSYTMKLITKNKIDYKNKVLIEKTKSIIYKGKKILKEHNHSVVRLNVISLSDIISLLELKGFRVLSVLDNNALYNGDPEFRLNKNSTGYLVIAKSS